MKKRHILFFALILTGVFYSGELKAQIFCSPNQCIYNGHCYSSGDRHPGGCGKCYSSLFSTYWKTDAQGTLCRSRELIPPGNYYENDCDVAEYCQGGTSTDPTNPSFTCPTNFYRSTGSPCTDYNDCTVNTTCSSDHKCLGSYAAVGSTCDDSNPFSSSSICNGSGTCLGQCDNCDDGNPCTIDQCTKDACTTHPIVANLFCNDGRSCTSNDRCSTSGVCSGTAGVEVCDRADNDCDGDIDEDVSNVCGGCGPVTGEAPGTPCDGPGDTDLCKEGSWLCTSQNATSCIENSGNNIEICDGSDNDCDRVTDTDTDHFGEACSRGTGACLQTGTLICDTAAHSLVCSVVAGTPTPEICDGIDNDCDGQTDEGISDIANGCGSGLCRGNKIGTCSGGAWQWGECITAVQPADCDQNACTPHSVCSNGECVPGANTGQNECGGCEALANTPDTSCGTCGTWQCDANGGTSCNGDHALNACEGCTELSGTLGAICGECGVLTCNGTDNLKCDGDHAKNSCGGCGTLTYIGSPANVGGQCVIADAEQCKNIGVLNCSSDPNLLACLPDSALSNDKPCDDGNACTTDEKCQGGDCKSATLVLPEIYNGIDDNCNGEIDEGLDCAEGSVRECNPGQCSGIEHCVNGQYDRLCIFDYNAQEKLCVDTDHDACLKVWMCNPANGKCESTGPETATDLTTGDGCCPFEATSETDIDCRSYCGDTVFDESKEKCDTSAGVPCTEGCYNGDVCMKEVITGSASTCDLDCQNVPITQCDQGLGDGCCPAGCKAVPGTANFDADCPSTCDGKVKEAGEICDGSNEECNGGYHCDKCQCVPDEIKPPEPKDEEKPPVVPQRFVPKKIMRVFCDGASPYIQEKNKLAREKFKERKIDFKSDMFCEAETARVVIVALIQNIPFLNYNKDTSGFSQNQRFELIQQSGRDLFSYSRDIQNKGIDSSRILIQRGWKTDATPSKFKNALPLLAATGTTVTEDSTTRRISVNEGVVTFDYSSIAADQDKYSLELAGGNIDIKLSDDMPIEEPLIEGVPNEIVSYTATVVLKGKAGFIDVEYGAEDEESNYIENLRYDADATMDAYINQVAEQSELTKSFYLNEEELAKYKGKWEMPDIYGFVLLSESANPEMVAKLITQAKKEAVQPETAPYEITLQTETPPVFGDQIHRLEAPSGGGCGHTIVKVDNKIPAFIILAMLFAPLVVIGTVRRAVCVVVKVRKRVR